MTRSIFDEARLSSKNLPRITRVLTYPFVIFQKKTKVARLALQVTEISVSTFRVTTQPVATIIHHTFLYNKEDNYRISSALGKVFCEKLTSKADGLGITC